MKIAFNPSTVAALITPPNNKDITFDLRGRNIFARGVKFCGTDTNTWRDIKINNVSIGSNILDLRNGSNTTLTNTNGVVTINSTWRPVVDNLTSDSTTSSLSAKQGKILKSLIDGKSNSDHNHDGRYLRLNGSDTMQGNLYLHSHGTSYIGRGLGDKSGADFTEANIVIRSWWGISFKSYDDIVRTYIDTRTGNIGTKGVLNAVGAVIQGRVYNGGDDEGIIIKPASNGYAGLILGAHNSERSVFYLTKGNPFWRYNNGSTNLDIQHPKKSGTIALLSDIPSSLKNPYSLTTFGVVYDGSSAKTVTTSTFISQVNEAASTVTDGTMLITSWASNSGFADTNAVNVPYKRKAIHLWEYIKTKTDSLYATKGHNHDDRYLKLTGGTMTGSIAFSNSSYLLWNNGSYHQRIFLTDDSTADTAVFTFQQSSDSGVNWSNLMTIRDNGKVIANTFVGALQGNASTATKLTSSAGNAALPIYFSDGKPVACTASSIFSNLSNSGNNISVTVAGQNRTLTVGYATSAGYANGIANKGLLDSQEKIDNFITANRFEYATFKTTESNNVGFASNDGMILSIPWGSTTYGAQIAFDDVHSATVKVRSKSTSWGNWYTLLHSGNYNNYAPSKTGTGASGTWGINISGNADTVDGVHVNQLCRIYTFNVHNSIIKVGTLTSGQSGHVCKLRFNSGIGYNAGNQDKTMTVVIRASNGNANSNGFYFEAHSESYRSGEFTTFYLHQTSKTQCELYMSAFSWSGQSIYEVSFSDGDSWTNEISVQNALPTSNIFTLPNYQIAYTDYNVASATKLATARTIWGQSFDGTGNISGTLSGVAHIQFSADNTYNIGSNSAASKYIYTYWLGAKSGQKLELGANNSGYGQGLCIDTNLNVGIGTNTPTYKLHVNGTFRATNSTVSDLFVNTGDATLKIYTGITTDAQNDGNICFQTSIDAKDGQSHAYPTQYQSRCNIVLQPRGGQVYIGTNPGTGNTTYKLYVNSKIFSNGGFVKNGSSDSYVLLGGGGHKAVSDFATASSLNNYVTTNTAQTISGVKTFSTQQKFTVGNGTAPFTVSSNTLVTNLNADLLDGVHLIKSGSGTGIKQVYYFSTQGNNSSYIKLGTLPSVSATGYGSSKVMFTVKGGINFGGTIESVYEVAASTRGSIQVTSTLVRGNRGLKFGYVSTSSNVEIWMAYDGIYRGATEVEVSSSISFTLAMTETTTKPSGFVEGSYRILAATEDNVASATKLQTPRTIWGQSFDGTSDVNGLLTHIISSDDQFLNVHDNRTTSGFQAIRYFRNGADVAAIHWFHDKYGGYDWNSNCLNLDPYAGGCVTLGRWNNPDLTVIREGNIGISTTSPSYKLHVNGTLGVIGTITTLEDVSIKNTTAVQKQFKVINNLSELWMGVDHMGETFLWTPSNARLILGTNNSHRLDILENGNVGIGTTSPAYKLHVAGDIYTTTGFKKNGSSDSYVLLGGGGHKLVSDFATLAQGVGTIISISKSLTPTTSWVDTGIKTDLATFPEGNGSYIIQISVPSSSGTDGWGDLYTGYFSLYTGTNSSTEDEILLHGASHALLKRIYLKTKATANTDGTMHFYIASEIAFSAARTINFKFRKLI